MATVVIPVVELRPGMILADGSVIEKITSAFTWIHGEDTVVAHHATIEPGCATNTYFHPSLDAVVRVDDYEF